jgi:glycosyltransferase involved in cell wall biosynthesis
MTEPMPRDNLKRKILYVNFDFPPLGGPGVWRALWFTKYLAASGYHVTVLCSDRSWWCDRTDQSLLRHVPSSAKIIRLKSLFPGDPFSSIDGLIRPMGKIAEEEACGIAGRKLRKTMNAIMSGIRWRVEKYYPDPNFVWLLIASGCAIYLSMRERFDCLITSGPPHICHVVGLLVKRLSRIPWIMDYRDLWLDDPNQSPQAGYQRKICEFLEREAVKKCDAVLTVSPSWAKHLADKYGAVKHKSRFHIIRNGHNLDVSTAHSDKRTTKQLHIHHNGTPQAPSKTAHLLDALYALKSSNSYIDKLPLFTFTGMTDSFREEIRLRGLETLVIDVGSMPYLQSIEYSGKADVILITVNNDHPAMCGVIPAKTYEAIALGQHIFAVVPPASDIRELLEEYGNATVGNVDDVHDIQRCLAELIESHDTNVEREVDLVHIEQTAGKFSRKNLTDQLIYLMESLIHENKYASEHFSAVSD